LTYSNASWFAPGNPSSPAMARPARVLPAGDERSRQLT
jgi:hypothetical protein